MKNKNLCSTKNSCVSREPLNGDSCLGLFVCVVVLVFFFPSNILYTNISSYFTFLGGRGEFNLPNDLLMVLIIKFLVHHAWNMAAPSLPLHPNPGSESPQEINIFLYIYITGQMGLLSPFVFPLFALSGFVFGEIYLQD